MENITYKRGDLFKNLDNHGKCVVPHCCNDIGVMGGGFVVPLQRHFPSAKDSYVEWYNKGQAHSGNVKFELGRTQFVRVTDNVVIANMIGQHNCSPDKDGNPPIRYAAIVKCMEQVGNYAKARGLEIVAPKFGSALAGGEWDFIEDLIYEIWLMNDLKVTVYEL